MYQEPKKNRRIRTVLLLLAVLAAVGLLVGVFAAVLKKAPSPATDLTEDRVTDEKGNVMNDGQVHALPARMLFAPRALFAAPAGSASADPITATVEAVAAPNNAADKRVDWSLAFVNANSEWAAGKTLSEYVTVTPSADGSLVATVSCLQAFGEQIRLTVTSRENPDISASCLLDYKQQFTGLELSLSQTGKTPTVNNNSHTGTLFADFENESPLTVNYTYQKSDVWTVALADSEITAPILTVEYKEALATALNNAKEGSATVPTVNAGAMNFTVAGLFDKAFAEGMTTAEANAVINAIDTNRFSGVIFYLKDNGGNQIAKYTFTVDTATLKTQIRMESLSLNNTDLVFGADETYTITYRRAGMPAGLPLFEVGSEYGLSKQDGGSYPTTYRAGESVTVSDLKESFSCSGPNGNYHSGAGVGRASYRFKGWYLDSGKTVPFDGTIPAGTVGNVTLYADIEITGTHNY